MLASYFLLPQFHHQRALANRKTKNIRARHRHKETVVIQQRKISEDLWLIVGLAGWILVKSQWSDGRDGT